MKEHSNNFETEIKTYGRQQAVQVIFEQDGQEVVLDNENVFSVTPNYKASLLKSAMKCLILDCNVEIPVGTRLQFKYGILVNNTYEYLNFGYYIVNKIEKKEDARSYEITCYDKMMLTMVDYIDLEISYPITIRNYIAAICNHLEIDFGSYQDQFVNYDKEISSELYLDENGNSLDYTFRDVLDELSQVTASIICIDENDQLVVKYPQRNGDYETIEGTNLYIENADDSKIELELEGNTTQNGTPTPDTPIEVNNVTGEQVARVCGKNILPQDKYINNTTINGITYTNNRDGTFSASGTATANTSIVIIPIGEIELEANQPYYLYSSIPYNANTFNLSIVMWENNATKYLTANNTYTPTTTPIQERLALWIPNGVSVNIQNAKIMLVKGSTRPTEYEKLQNKDYEINLGKNLYEGSQDFSGTWANSNGWITAEETYNGLVVKYRQNVWGGLYKEIYVQRGDVYTFSFFAKKETGGEIRAYLVGSGVGATPENKSFNVTTEWQRYSFTFTITTSGKLRARIENPNNDSITYICGYQLEKNNVMTSYSPYFTPIELNKIGNYQDFIRKGNGKNLADIEKVNLGYTLNDDGTLYASPTRSTIFQIAVKPSTQYSLSVASNYQIGNLFYYKEDKTFLSMVSSGWGNNKVITTPSGAYYISFATRVSTDATMVESDLTNLHIQIEENSSVTYYEPYGYKDKWYIEKNISNVILNGTETWTGWTSQDFTNTILVGTTKIDNIGKIANVGLCDRFSINANLWSVDTEGIQIKATGGNQIVIRVSKSVASDYATFKTWLQTNNTKVYYVLANPTYTLIENEELLNQLEAVQLQTGENNVLVSGDLPSIIKVSYVKEFKSIDEEQLKDINVNFGEKYGPINSVVIARAADSDFIYKEDEKSVAEDGLCEVKISDNQILNGDNRTQFLDGIYYQLKGTEFYLNDFSSTGIVYLDLLDYYKVKVFDNSYKCLMLNDEIDITQGLQEQVFTERPKESETEYKSIAKQDKDIRKIGIIVNKVEGEITAEIIARQDTDEKVSNLTQTIGEISTTVSTTTTQVEDLENRVYTNETSISQNSDSITATISRIQQTEDDVETLQTNTEDVVKQLVFGDDGLTISAKGTTSDDMKLNLTNDAIKFLYQNNAILTINGSTIEFSNASFKKLDLGNYVWQAEDDDSLSLIYEGE